MFTIRKSPKNWQLYPFQFTVSNVKPVGDWWKKFSKCSPGNQTGRGGKKNTMQRKTSVDWSTKHSSKFHTKGNFVNIYIHVDIELTIIWFNLNLNLIWIKSNYCLRLARILQVMFTCSRLWKSGWIAWRLALVSEQLNCVFCFVFSFTIEKYQMHA